MYTNYQGYGDWDFRGENTKEFTHCFHIYPAMMIPQVARGLIELYGNEGDLLFDPYCGSGTSLVEGRLRDMNVCGTDLNPTARLIAKAKSIDYNLVQLKLDMAKFQLDLEDELESIQSLDGFNAPKFVTFERLQDWFPIKSIAEVSHCIHKSLEIENIEHRNFILIALSECLRLISFQRNGEFKLYRIKEDERGAHYIELHTLLTKRLERNLAGLEEFTNSVKSKTGDVKVYDFNTVETDGGEIIGRRPNIVVTSPPYGDSGTTVAYAQFSWLTNVWLGLDSQAPGALDRSLMGGRKDIIEKFGFQPMDQAINAIVEENEKRAKEVMHFYSEYHDSIKNVASIVQDGGYVCYVVGNRTVKGIQLPTDQFTAWAFEQEGFEYVTTYLRDIPNKRMPSKNSPTNKAGKKVTTMHKEYLVVLKNRNTTDIEPEDVHSSGRSYSGKKYIGKITCLAELDIAMKWLVSNSPFPSVMQENAPCSIGETVEEILGLPPSTTRVDLHLADAKVELKSDRIKSSTPKSEATSTLKSVNGVHFTGTSDSDRYTQFVQKYGYTTQSASLKGVRTQKDYKNRINLYHKLTEVPHRLTQLYIEYDHSEDKIWVCHQNDGRILFYDQTNIDEIEQKYKLQYSIHGNEVTKNNETWFDFKSVDALTTTLAPFSIKNMYDAVVSGSQVLEFRAHICDDIYCPSAGSKQCKDPGGLRCRGTAFRTPKSKISEVWNVKQIAP
jgi:site-specific DNA-methyltransferase (cytosine-N4-specific)